MQPVLTQGESLHHYDLITHFNLPQTYPKDFVVLDFETTGLSPQLDEIIQIGAIKYQNCAPVAHYQTFVNPLREIPTKITELTGIKQEDVSLALTIEHLLPELISFIGNHPIVAHHAPFDINVLNINLAKINISPVQNMVIDTLVMARLYAPFTVSDYKLETLKKEMKIKLPSHQAINDCFVTGELYLECKNIVDYLGKETLNE